MSRALPRALQLRHQPSDEQRELLKRFTSATTTDIPQIVAESLSSFDELFAPEHRPELSFWSPALDQLHKYYNCVVEAHAMQLPTIGGEGFDIIFLNAQVEDELSITLRFHVRLLRALHKKGQVVQPPSEKCHVLVQCQNPEIVLNYLLVVSYAGRSLSLRQMAADSTMGFIRTAHLATKLSRHVTLTELCQIDSGAFVPPTVEIELVEKISRPGERTLPSAVQMTEKTLSIKNNDSTLMPKDLLPGFCSSLLASELHDLWMLYRVSTSPSSVHQWLGISLLSASICMQNFDADTIREISIKIKGVLADIPNLLSCVTPTNATATEMLQTCALTLIFACHLSMCDDSQHGASAPIMEELRLSFACAHNGYMSSLLKTATTRLTEPTTGFCHMLYDMLLKSPTLLLGRRASNAITNMSPLHLNMVVLVRELFEALPTWIGSNPRLCMRLLRTVSLMSLDDSVRALMSENGMVERIIATLTTLVDRHSDVDSKQSLIDWKAATHQAYAGTHEPNQLIKQLRQARISQLYAYPQSEMVIIENTMLTFLFVWRPPNQHLSTDYLIESRFMQTLLHILQNYHRYGATLVGGAWTTLTNIINDDPQKLASIVEKGFVAALEQQLLGETSDPRSLMSIPGFIFALCLTSDGAMEVKTRRLLPQYVKQLFDQSVLELGCDVTPHMGKEFADICRHYVDMAPDVVASIKECIALFVREIPLNTPMKQSFVQRIDIMSSWLGVFMRESNVDERSRYDIGRTVLDMLRAVCGTFTGKTETMCTFHRSVSELMQNIRSETVWIEFLQLIEVEAVAALKKDNKQLDDGKVESLSVLLQLVLPTFSGSATALPMAIAWAEQTKGLASILLDVYLSVLRQTEKRAFHRVFLQSIEATVSGLSRFCSPRFQFDERRGNIKAVQEVVSTTLVAVLQNLRDVDFSQENEEYFISSNLTSLLSATLRHDRGGHLVLVPEASQGFCNVSAALARHLEAGSTSPSSFDDLLAMFLGLLRNLAQAAMTDDDSLAPSAARRTLTDCVVRSAQSFISLSQDKLGERALVRLCEVVAQILTQEERWPQRNSIALSFTPSEAAIDILQEQGFSRGHSELALRELRSNDVSRAANWLRQNGPIPDDITPDGLSLIQIFAQRASKFVVSVIRSRANFELPAADVLTAASTFKRKATSRASSSPSACTPHLSKTFVFQLLLDELKPEQPLPLLCRAATTFSSLVSNWGANIREALVRNTQLTICLSELSLAAVEKYLSLKPEDRDVTADDVVSILGTVYTLTQAPTPNKNSAPPYIMPYNESQPRIICRHFVEGNCRMPHCPFSHDSSQVAAEKLLAAEASQLAESVRDLLRDQVGAQSDELDGDLQNRLKQWEEILLDSANALLPCSERASLNVTRACVRLLNELSSKLLPRGCEHILLVLVRCAQLHYSCAQVVAESDCLVNILSRTYRLEPDIGVKAFPKSVVSIPSLYYNLLKIIADEPTYIQALLENSILKFLAKFTDATTGAPRDVMISTLLSELETQRRQHPALFLKALKSRCELKHRREGVFVSLLTTTSADGKTVTAPARSVKLPHDLDNILHSVAKQVDTDLIRGDFVATAKSDCDNRIFGCFDLLSILVGVSGYAQTSSILKLQTFLPTLIKHGLSAEQNVNPAGKKVSRVVISLISGLFVKNSERVMSEITSALRACDPTRERSIVVGLGEVIVSIKARTAKLSADRITAFNKHLASDELRDALLQVISRIPLNHSSASVIIQKLLRAVEVYLSTLVAVRRQPPPPASKTPSSKPATPRQAAAVELALDLSENDEFARTNSFGDNAEGIMGLVDDEHNDDGDDDDDEDEEDTEHMEEEDDDDEDEDEVMDEEEGIEEGDEAFGHDGNNVADFILNALNGGEEDGWHVRGTGGVTLHATHGDFDFMHDVNFGGGELGENIDDFSSPPANLQMSMASFFNRLGRTGNTFPSHDVSEGLITSLEQINGLALTPTNPMGYRASAIRDAPPGGARGLPHDGLMTHPHDIIARGELIERRLNYMAGRSAPSAPRRTAYSSETLGTALAQFISEEAPAQFHRDPNAPAPVSPQGPASPVTDARSPSRGGGSSLREALRRTIDDSRRETLHFTPSQERPANAGQDMSLADSLVQALASAAPAPSVPSMTPPSVQADAQQRDLEQQLLSLLQAGAPAPAPLPPAPDTTQAEPAQTTTTEPQSTSATPQPEQENEAEVPTMADSTTSAVGDRTPVPESLAPAAASHSTQQSTTTPPAWENVIDPTCLGALPEDLRSEILRSSSDVIFLDAASTVTLPDGSELSTCVEPRFMALLPEDLHAEILALEQQILEDRQSARQAAAAAGATVMANPASGAGSGMDDTAMLLASLSPEDREEILREMPDEEIERLPESLAAEARAARQRMMSTLSPQMTREMNRILAEQVRIAPRASGEHSATRMPEPPIRPEPEASSFASASASPLLPQECVNTLLRLVFTSQLHADTTLLRIFTTLAASPVCADWLLQSLLSLLSFYLTRGADGSADAKLVLGEDDFRQITEALNACDSVQREMMVGCVTRCADAILTLLREREPVHAACHSMDNQTSPIVRIARVLQLPHDVVPWAVVHSLLRSLERVVPMWLARSEPLVKSEDATDTQPQTLFPFLAPGKLKWSNSCGRCAFCGTVREMECAYVVEGVPASLALQHQRENRSTNEVPEEECYAVCASCYWTLEKRVDAVAVSDFIKETAQEGALVRGVLHSLSHEGFSGNALTFVKKILEEMAHRFEFGHVFNDMVTRLSGVVLSLRAAIRDSKYDNISSNLRILDFFYEFLASQSIPIPVDELRGLWGDVEAVVANYNSRVRSHEKFQSKDNLVSLASTEGLEDAEDDVLIAVPPHGVPSPPRRKHTMSYVVDVPPAILQLMQSFLNFHVTSNVQANNGSNSERSSPTRSEERPMTVQRKASFTTSPPAAAAARSTVSEAAEKAAKKHRVNVRASRRSLNNELSVVNDDGSEWVVPHAKKGCEAAVSRFVEDNRALFAHLIRNDPDLVQRPGPFRVILRHNTCVDLEVKKKWFRDALKKIVPQHVLQSEDEYHGISLRVDRRSAFQDTFANVRQRRAREFLGPLKIRFRDEEGVDAGGVLREWFGLMGKEMLNADYGLFVRTSEGYTYQPNQHSSINSEHLAYFKMCGRIVGLSLLHDIPMDVHLTRSVYKHMLGFEPTYRDLESVEPTLYQSLVVWMLENDVTPMQQTFEVDIDRFGANETIELIPDGKNTIVTNENKLDYVAKLASYKMTVTITDQLKEFMTGFYEIIPRALVSIFAENELEMLISGLPDFDVDDLKVNTHLQNYSSSSPQVLWLWRYLSSISLEQRSAFWQFCTGSCKVPAGGFKYLEGQNGRQPFTVQRVPRSEKLPVSHTCFNTLELPEYESYEELEDKLTKAVQMGSQYFGIV